MAETWLLLGRPDCHLCEDFEAALLAYLQAHPEPAVTLEQACVDDRNHWRLRYGQRIPVLLDGNDRVLCEGRFDAGQLARGRA